MLPRTIAVVAVATLLFAILPASPAMAKPIAVVPEPIKSFEVVPKGDVVRHRFEIKNDGDQPLQITEVRPACGCTVANFDKVIAPGSSGFVQADLDTGNFSGGIQKSIAVFTNDTENAKIQLLMRAEVRPYVSVDPGYARFNYVQGEDLGVITQSIFSPDGADLKVLEATSPYSYVDVSFRKSREDELVGETPGEQWRVEIKLAADAPVGALRDYVELKLDHPQQTSTRIPVSGFVRPRTHVTPQLLDFGEVEADQLPYEVKFQLTSFTTDGIDVTKVETGIEGLGYEVKALVDSGHRFEVVLRFGKDVAKGDIESTLRVHTTDPKNPLLELPLKGRIL